MRLEDAFVIPADITPDEALRRLRELPERAMIVIVREDDGAPRYYAFPAGALVHALSGSTADDLTTALGLHEWSATPDRQLSALSGDDDTNDRRRGSATAAPDVVTPTVVLHGDAVLGVAMPLDTAHGPRSASLDDAIRSVEAPPTVDPPETTFAPTRGGALPDEEDTPPTVAIDDEVFESAIDDAGEPAEGNDPGARISAANPGEPAQASEPAGRQLFRAFPDLDAPDAVAHGEPFTLEVRLTRDAADVANPAGPGDAQPDPILVADAPPALSFVVSVVGFGFTFPDQVRATLDVARDDPDSSSVTFTVVAQPVRHDVVRVLEVSFEHEGNVCGRAWREVHVGAAQAPAPTTPPLTGGAGVATPPPEHTPHLTIEIRSQQGDAEIEWLFHSRYTDLPFPTAQVTTRLGEGSAKEFAVQVMAQMPAQQGSVFLDDAMRGVGRRVAAALPFELWSLMDQAWARAREASETPTLLIQTNEPYVPWELAWLDGDYVDPALLDDPLGGCLGQLWRVGRWIPPIARTPRGGDRPPSPPAVRVDVDAMAVVIGDYASDANLRPLPEAIAEGQDIALRYKALPLQAIEVEIDKLMGNELIRNGEAFTPRAVHVAAHGQVSPDTQQYTGIILSQTGRRLDPLIVQGASLSRLAQPFVFLNACQVGTAGKVLSEYGGLASAFLSEGCRGFVAPLWNVDDKVARQFAVAFYEAAFDAGTPVSEVLRTLRGVTGVPWAEGSATPMAYVFYGHPALTLVRA